MTGRPQQGSRRRPGYLADGLPDYTRHWDWEVPRNPVREVSIGPGDTFWIGMRGETPRRVTVEAHRATGDERAPELVVRTDEGVRFVLRHSPDPTWFDAGSTVARAPVHTLAGLAEVGADGVAGPFDRVAGVWFADPPPEDRVIEHL